MCVEWAWRSSPADGGSRPFRPAFRAGARRSMLLVHHSQTQPGKLHALTQDGVGAHHKVGLVTADGSQRGAAGGGLHAAGQQGHTHPEGGQHPVQILCVLGGKDLGGASSAA